MTLGKTAEHVPRCFKFDYTIPKLFDLERLARKAHALDVPIVATIGLPSDKDASSMHAGALKTGKAILADAKAAVSDVGGDKLDGILYSAHTKYDQKPTKDSSKSFAHAIVGISKNTKDLDVDSVLILVNQFEANLLNSILHGHKFCDDVCSNHVKLCAGIFQVKMEDANPAYAIFSADNQTVYFHIGDPKRGFFGKGNIVSAHNFDACVKVNYSRDAVGESVFPTPVDEDLSFACATLGPTMIP